MVAVLLVGVLPAPRVSTSLIFTATSDGAGPVDSTDRSHRRQPASLPAHAASPAGRTGVGGFLGFAKSLDTADRVALGDEVVMRVRATRPNYWVGQTFDTGPGRAGCSPAPRSTGRRPRR